MVGELLTLLKTHLSLRLQITLVSNKDARNVIGGVLFNFSHPVLDCRERFTIGDVVGDNDTVGTLVVAGCDGFEAFLPGSVPNLELDCLSVNFVITNLKVNTDCWHKVLTERIIL